MHMARPRTTDPDGGAAPLSSLGRTPAQTDPPRAGNGGPPNPIRRLFQILGPGLITGASDDDPSGIGTYALAGASLGYAPLWLALLTFPLMAAVQFICAKIGMVTGVGLAGVLRRHYPRGVLYSVVLTLLVANTINAGVDIGAIAAGAGLLIPIPFAILVVTTTVTILVLQVWGSYRLIVGIFKWLTLALFAYIGSSFFARPDWSAVLRGTLLPTLRWDAEFLAMLVAILGTTISPYLFFWQASQEAEEMALCHRQTWRRRGGASATELRCAAWDTNIGMFLSNVVMFFIILGTAATLHEAGQTNIGSAAEAAEALRPLAGDAATVLLALGLVGAGFLAVPVLTTSAASEVCEAFDWRQGLDERPGRAGKFYALIAGSTLVGMLINFVGLNPVTALFWTAVLNGLLTPPLLLIIMLIANNRHVMGKRVNGLGVTVLRWLTTVTMFAAAAGLLLIGSQS
jgi:NRAMP (natural resistance-associated macrophage protein)-like metal ion transporter